MRGAWTLVWKALTDGLAGAVRALGLGAEERLRRLELAVPRDAGHGDWTTNLALILARDLGQPPRAIAERLAAAFVADPELLEPPEVAGPGFLNFRYSRSFLERLPARIAAEGERFGGSQGGAGVRIQVEYVSANPTGPLNVVNARAAAVGATLVRLLSATGHAALGEFYVNDSGRQVELLGESVAARFAERVGRSRPFPENGYQGDYLRDIASELPESEARAALERPGGGAWFMEQALERMLAWQRRDLSEYGAEFERWFRESSLHQSGAVAAALEALREREMLYVAGAARPQGDGEAAAPPADRGEATWVKTRAFGDDKDRVVVKSDGAVTYLLPDIAYHLDKRRRGFRHAIDLWGPDHQGHIVPLRASLTSLGVEPDFLEVLIVQQVNLLSGGKPYRMSKRAGEFITLRDLMNEVGTDCAKFFFLMRSTSAHLDFDLDLAKQQNDENPAYYVQYAHARIVSLLRKAAEAGVAPRLGPSGVELQGSEEIGLLRKLAAFPEVVRGAAQAREPHRLPTYLMDVAAEFHRFYHATRTQGRWIARSPERLLMADASRIVLRNGLALMGVSAPQRMAREAEVGS